MQTISLNLMKNLLTSQRLFLIISESSPKLRAWRRLSKRSRRKGAVWLMLWRLRLLAQRIVTCTFLKKKMVLSSDLKLNCVQKIWAQICMLTAIMIWQGILRSLYNATQEKERAVKEDRLLIKSDSKTLDLQNHS